MLRKIALTAALAAPLLLTAGPAHADVVGDADPFLMIVHEDGSGQLIMHLGDGRITGAGTFAEGSLPWDCTVNGNRVCGPHTTFDEPAAVSWTTGTWTGTVHTDGRLTVRPYRAGDSARFVGTV